MEASGYSIDLYCDKVLPDTTDEDVVKGKHKFGEFPHQFLGKTRGKCVVAARSRGWVFHRDGKHTCPRCAGG